MAWWKKVVAWSLLALLAGMTIFAERDVTEMLVRGPVSLVYFAVISAGLLSAQ